MIEVYPKDQMLICQYSVTIVCECYGQDLDYSVTSVFECDGHSGTTLIYLTVRDRMLPTFLA